MGVLEITFSRRTFELTVSTFWALVGRRNTFPQHFHHTKHVCTLFRKDTYCSWSWCKRPRINNGLCTNRAMQNKFCCHIHYARTLIFTLHHISHYYRLNLLANKSFLNTRTAHAVRYLHRHDGSHYRWPKPVSVPKRNAEAAAAATPRLTAPAMLSFAFENRWGGAERDRTRKGEREKESSQRGSAGTRRWPPQRPRFRHVRMSILDPVFILLHLADGTKLLHFVPKLPPAVPFVNQGMLRPLLDSIDWRLCLCTMARNEKMKRKSSFVPNVCYDCQRSPFSWIEETEPFNFEPRIERRYV